MYHIVYARYLMRPNVTNNKMIVIIKKLLPLNPIFNGY